MAQDGQKVGIEDLRLTRRDLVAGAAALGATVLCDKCAEAQAAPKRGGDLVMAISQGNTTDSLDPARHTADYMYCVATQIYDSLTRVDENVKVQPGLAETWDVKPGA